MKYNGKKLESSVVKFFSDKIQKELIKSCLKILKKGGILIYSTCTLEPEENELNMQWALENFRIRLEPIKTGQSVGDKGLTDIFGKRLDKQIEKCKRFWPNKTQTEGFFIAKVKKL